MTEQPAAKKTVPPYMPFRTLTTFCEGLKAGMPQRIDRSINQMKSMSGTMQAQLMATLEYLRLITSVETGIPTEQFNQYIHLTGEERQAAFKEILTSSYQFIFKDGLDLQTATARQLQESFEEQGVSGDTLRKAIAFFLKAAKEAGLKLSPHFKRTYTKRSSGPRSKRKTDTAQTPVGGAAVTQGETGSNPPGDLSWQKFLFEKFPAFDPEWPDDVKKEWFQAIRGLKPDFEKKSEE